MTPVFFADFIARRYNGNAIDLDGTTIKVALLTSAYVPNAATQSLYSAISANEVSGTGYAAGGVTVTGSALSFDGSILTWNHDPVTWAQNAAGFANARYAVWYASASSRLIMYADLGANRGVVNGPLIITPATGVALF